jgi:hypothetical protein
MTVALVRGQCTLSRLTGRCCNQGDNSQFALVLICLAAVLTTVYKRLDRGLATVCIYMAAAQAVAIDTSGPGASRKLRSISAATSMSSHYTGHQPTFSSCLAWMILRVVANHCMASDVRSSLRAFTSR